VSESIKHFIWPYQTHFRFGVEFEAKRVLSRLSDALQPRTFLVAVRTSDDVRLHPACVAPEHHHWLKSETLYDVLADVDGVAAGYRESQVFHSHPVAQERETEYLRRRALRDLVMKATDGAEDRPEDVEVFLSMPMERPDFLVLVGLTLSRTALGGVPQIEKASVKIHEYLSYPIPQSLAHATIEELLRRSAREVMTPEAGIGPVHLGAAEELLRTAAADFSDGLIKRLGERYLLTGGHFDLIGDLSLLPYEGRGATGAIGLWESPEEVVCDVEFADPVPLRESKSLRKLLMLADDGWILVSDGEAVLGLLRPEVAEDRPPALRLEVTERGAWSLHADGTELMTVRDGRPRLPKPPADEASTAFELRRRVPALGEAEAARYASVAVGLARAEHGAVLIIADNAADEAERLNMAGLPVAPVKLDPEIALRFSQIDGATLCDAEGFCRAVGVILDGHATERGDRGRGARFNSSVRYVESHGAGAAAIVVSEDGGLDLLPQLKPAVETAELSRRLTELRAVAASTARPLNRRRENNAIERVVECSHVLTEEQCDQVNRLISEISDRAHAAGQVRVVRQPLEQDASFDPVRDLY
jgi:hypothetical protein